MKVRVEKTGEVVNEEGKHVGSILGKKAVYCFLCDKTFPSIKHYKEQH